MICRNSVSHYGIGTAIAGRKPMCPRQVGPVKITGTTRRSRKPEVPAHNGLDPPKVVDPIEALQVMQFTDTYSGGINRPLVGLSSMCPHAFELTKKVA